MTQRDESRVYVERCASLPREGGVAFGQTGVFTRLFRWQQSACGCVCLRHHPRAAGRGHGHLVSCSRRRKLGVTKGQSHLCIYARSHCSSSAFPLSGRPHLTLTPYFFCSRNMFGGTSILCARDRKDHHFLCTSAVPLKKSCPEIHTAV